MLLKMKTLNDRLNHAYEEINNMTNFGEASILSFDPLNFSLLSKVDGVARQIIRNAADAFDKGATGYRRRAGRASGLAMVPVRNMVLMR